MPSRPVTNQAVRRYPALLFLVVAGVLATLLPSTLRLPLSGPSSAAELAPVPGKSDTSAGDLSALGLSTTGGLGSGLGGVPGGRPPGDDDSLRGGTSGGDGANPRNKLCVGSPPRQTEDPLSPVCVAFFAGDNGGATSKGVTADEIRIVVENCNYSSDTDVFIDYQQDHPEAEHRYVAYSAHFNRRFQLFDRRAHFYEVRWTDCRGEPAVRRAQVQEINERYDPFAVLSQRSVLGTRDGADELSRLKIVNQLDAPERSFTSAKAPYVYSVNPDLDDHIAMSAEFICRRLAGRPARHSGDVQDHQKLRKFGISYEMPSDPERVGARMLVKEVGRRCGEVAPIADYSSDGTGGDSVASMRFDNVTTVVKFGLTTADVLAAEAAGWHPEWAVLDSQFSGSNSIQMPAGQWRNAFGFVFERRLGVPQAQAAYVAAEDGCSGCGPWGSADSYDALLFLFWGIQSAGPRLTPSSFEQGLRALPQRRSTDPYLPAAYLTAGNHSWIKDAAAVWWDPTGRPPGWANVGCFRLIEDGLRYRAEDWATKPGDGSIKGADGSTPPCQGLS